MWTFPGTTPPAPGIYTGMSTEDYHKVAALSKSRMDALHKSPAHLLAYLAEQHEDTAATILGSLTHTLTMEPELYALRFRAYDDIRRSNKIGKANCEEAEGAHLTPITKETLAQAEAMAQALRSHPTAAGAFLAEGTQFEVSVFWVEVVNGVSIPCKARLDILNRSLPGLGCLTADVKKSRDASPRGMARSIMEYRYHVQAAWYRRGVYLAAGLHSDAFYLLCVEDAAPYLAAIYEISEDAQQMALHEIKTDMETLAGCIESGNWPGYPDGIMTLDLPAWAYRKEAA